MNIQNPQSNWRYTRTARWLHWILAALIIFLLALGWTMMSVEHRPGGARPLFDLHKSLGLAVLVLVAARLVWRLSHPVAPLPDYVPAWQKTLATVTEWGLYACMVAMPVIGYLGASHQKQPPQFFGLATPAWTQPNHNMAERLFDIHGLIAWPLVALIILHVAGALKHILIDKDKVFWRMSFGTDKGAPGGKRPG
jgi:cytochrome b561